MPRYSIVDFRNDLPVHARYTSVNSNEIIHVTEEYWILSHQMYKKEKKKKQEDEGRKEGARIEILEKYKQ